MQKKQAKLRKTKSKTKSQKVIAAAKKESFPICINPMLATLVNEIPTSSDWLYEIKWDGYRALAFCRDEQINLLSRNQKSFNDKFYPIISALKELHLQAILDGEIVVIKKNGAADFSGLQNWRSEADGELVYYVFDILWLNGRNLMSFPLHQRKDLLEKLFHETNIIRKNKEFIGSPQDFLAALKKMGLEGMIAKKTDSTYTPGNRSQEWLKIKTKNKQEVVIGGFTLNESSPKLFSALLVGVYENGVLQYAGKVGTGFSDKLQKEMMQKFKPLLIKKCPFSFVPDVNKPSRFRPNPAPAKAFWLQPKLVCEVSYVEITSDGMMRHPSFQGMREDKNANDVHAETPKKIRKVNKTPINIVPAPKSERKTLLNPKEDSQTKIIKGNELKFNHLNKIFWPNEGYTKRDLINYYYLASSYLLPYLKDRPQSLNRFPNGIESESFYQKDVTKAAPSWIEKYPYRTSQGEDKNFLIVKTESDLLWMANLGSIEMNPWNSTIKKPEYPTWCSIDIDPTEKNSFEQVIEIALMTKKILDALKIEGYCKTSGGDGMHIYIPMGEKYTYEQVQLFGRLIATHVHEALPAFTSIERYTDKRKGKVYVDFLQNRPKATLAAPYSVRPKPGAPVSMPLHWDEVKKGLAPANFTLKNAIERMKAEGDLFKPVLGKGINLKKALEQL